MSARSSLESQIEVLESKLTRLTTEIQMKDSLIKELENKVSQLEIKLSAKPVKHLSAVCVENTNVPPDSSYANECEMDRIKPNFTPSSDVLRAKEREQELQDLKKMLSSQLSFTPQF